MIIYPGVFWTFAFSSKKYHGNDINPEKIDRMKTMEGTLKWYNHKWHEGSFMISNFHKKMTGIIAQ